MVHKKSNVGLVLLAIFLFFAVFLNFISWESFSVARDDDVYYINSGIDLVNGRYVETRMPPFYPLLIGLLTKLTGEGFLSARLISVFSGVLIIFAVYFLGKKIYSKEVGFLAAFLITIFPNRIILSSVAKSESLYTFLVIFSASFFIVFVERKRIGILASCILGLLLSALYLTRPEGLLYTVIFIGFLLVYRKIYLNKKIIVNLLVSIAVLLVFLLLYMIFLHSQTGRWTLTGKDENLFFSDWISSGGQWHHLNRLNEEGSKIVYANPYHSFKEAGVKALGRYAANFHLMLGIIGKIFSPFIFIFLGIGLLEIFRNEVERRKKIFLLFLVLPVLVYPFFHIKGDYLFPALFPLLIIAAQGIWESSRVIKSRRVFMFISIALITAIFLSDFFIFTQKVKAELPLEKKAIGVWMKEHLAEGNTMDIEPISAFYAHMPYVMFPYDGFKRTIAYARKNGVVYIILSQRDKNKYNPEIAALFDTQPPPGELELIKKDSSISGFDVLLFELEKSS